MHIGICEYDDPRFSSVHHLAGKCFWALLLIVVGTLLLLENLGYIKDIVKFWPVLLIVLGLKVILLSPWHLHLEELKKLGAPKKSSKGKKKA